jgi:hypothetical protein
MRRRGVSAAPLTRRIEMRFRKVIVIAVALAVLPLGGVFARGAGGFTWGEQYFEAELSNVDLGARITGVYGYSVTWGGQRYGGFAMAIHSDTTMPALEGGFVGAIAGQEGRMGPLMAAVTLWTGFGGMNVPPMYQVPGSLALVAELNVELGFGFLPGVMVTGYAGMQAIVPVSLDQGVIGNAMYTPVLGMRVAWGS